jgi:hypothetical protein
VNFSEFDLKSVISDLRFLIPANDLEKSAIIDLMRSGQKFTTSLRGVGIFRFGQIERRGRRSVPDCIPTEDRGNEVRSVMVIIEIFQETRLIKPSSS